MANENVQTPYDSTPPLVHLQWHALEDMELIEGQGEPAPVEDGQGSSPAVPPGTPDFTQESYFFKDPIGGQVFKTQEELAKAWEQSFLRREDYSRKTGDLASQRRQHEQERANFERQRKEFEEEMRRTRDEYKSFDERIRKNPQIYQMLKQQLNNQTGLNQDAIDRLIDQKYGDKFKKIDQWEAEKLANEQKSEAINALKLMYEDFDEGPIQEMYDKLLNDNSIQSLMEIFYHAHKGRSINPLDVERKMTAEIAKKRQAGLTSSQGSKATGSPVVHRTLNAAAAEAKKKYGG